MLGLKFERSPVETVGRDRLERKEFFSIQTTKLAEKVKSTMASQEGQSFYNAQANRYEGTIRMLGLKVESSPIKTV